MRRKKIVNELKLNGDDQGDTFFFLHTNLFYSCFKLHPFYDIEILDSSYSTCLMSNFILLKYLSLYGFQFK